MNSFSYFCVRNFLLAIVFLGIIPSCSKSDNSAPPDPGYFMRFKLNGTVVEYKGQVEGTFSKAGASQYSSGIAGLKEAFVGSKNNMSLAIATPSETQTNITYTNYTTTDAGSQKATVSSLGYFDAQGKFFSTWAEEFIPTLPSGTEVNAKIRVTEQTSSYLRGVFSGVLYNADYSVKLTVTDGEFYVKRKT